MNKILAYKFYELGSRFIYGILLEGNVIRPLLPPWRYDMQCKEPV